jgi:uncharacterized protein YaaW (UPF0174 family)
MTTWKAAFFVKNVPTHERVLRVAVALTTAVVALRLLGGPTGWAVASAALGFGMTGLFGFCPACALVGRRLPKQG